MSFPHSCLVLESLPLPHLHTQGWRADLGHVAWLPFLPKHVWPHVREQTRGEGLRKGTWSWIGAMASVGLGDPCLFCGLTHSQVGVFSLQDHVHGQLGGCLE